MMEKDSRLNRFVELMSTNISDSDLELVNLGQSLGLDLVLFTDLRNSQEEEFADKIREKAQRKMKKPGDDRLKQNDLFYAGSIDFMVCDTPQGKKFFLLETNGGSNRGLSILTEKQQAIMYDGYYRAIKQAIQGNLRGDHKVLVLIGVPIGDGLIHEKVIMLEYLRKRLKKTGKIVGVENVDTFNTNFEEDVCFLIADYKQLSTRLSFSENWVTFKDSPVSVLIGDGIARRLHEEEFQKLIETNFREINSIIVNPIYKITDDKSLTYLASYFAKDALKKYNLKYLLFTKAYDEEELIKKLDYVIKNYERPFIIKPNGGSGGAGVIPIASNEDPANLKNIIKKSKKEFFAKFMKNRNPYPYTIQEMAKFSLIDWRHGKHTFDIRIYLSQKEENIITPIGGLARIARGNYSGSLDKEEFVVNLSGFDGQIEVERGRGLSNENAELLNLTEEDFINIFSIGCVMFKTIAENYQKIIEFKDWGKIIGEE